MAKQRRNFRITYSRREGNGSDNEGNEWLFDKLDAERTDRPLGPRQLFFAAAGSDTHTFLINLKKKATAKFVKQVLGRALGPDYGYSVDLVETAKKGEKFVPGEREAEGRCRSTIEREAIEAGGESSASFVLVDASHRTTYSYDGRGGLSRLVREPRLPRDVDAGATKDSPQVRLRLFLRMVPLSNHARQQHSRAGWCTHAGKSMFATSLWGSWICTAVSLGPTMLYWLALDGHNPSLRGVMLQSEQVCARPTRVDQSIRSCGKTRTIEPTRTQAVNSLRLCVCGERTLSFFDAAALAACPHVCKSTAQ